MRGIQCRKAAIKLSPNIHDHQILRYFIFTCSQKRQCEKASTLYEDPSITFIYVRLLAIPRIKKDERRFSGITLSAPCRLILGYGDEMQLRPHSPAWREDSEEEHDPTDKTKGGEAKPRQRGKGEV